MSLCKHKIQENFCSRCTGAKGGRSKSPRKLKAVDRNLAIARKAKVQQQLETISK